MSIDPTATAERPSAPLVAAVITGTEPELVSRCIDAIERQVYDVAQVVVVGGDDEIRHAAGESDAMWRPTLVSAIEAIGSEYTFVWALRERAVPDPQALRVLVQDAMRVDASVAGSKIVDVDDPELLVSVGYATDAFGAPFSGLQPGEVDQAQYDVIRDVAAVSGVSVLIRRDLYLGLGGIDNVMAPTAAAIDFCQRARLRGGRVVVIPRSVVGFDGDEQSSDWRERAGEIRAMLKSYSPLTLLWTLPVAFMIGIVEGVARIPFGRFPLPGAIGAWFWNLGRLPSALRQRIQVRRGREAGDEELFRYQVSGSARLRDLWDDILLRVRDRFPDGVLSGFSEAVEAGQQRVRNPAFFVAALVVLFGLVATREVWTEHLPVGGFSLPPPESAGATLASYAGGWNPAGLGSPEVLRPSVGAVALAQLVLLGNGGVAIALITVASFILGSFGVGRLLRVWGVESVAGYLAGTTLMAGPAIIAATGASHWTAIPAFAAAPYAVRLGFLAAAAPTRTRRAAMFAAGAMAVGVMGVFVPVTLFVPLAAAAMWAVVGVGRRIAPLRRTAVMTLLSIPLLMPWVLYFDPFDHLRSGPAAYWSPSWPAIGAVAVAGLGALVSGDRLLSALGGWGASMAVAGAVVARTGGFDFGTEVLLGGLVLSGLGSAVAVGAGLEVVRRRREFGGFRALGAVAAGLGAAGLIVGTMALAGPGRAGLPEDALSGKFDFAIPTTEAPSRVLLFGDPDDLPGTAREIDGLGYRVFVPPYPATWEARLNDERLGDLALQETLEALASGRTRRGGAALAEYGIGWVAFVDQSPLESVFESQLDLVALRSLDFPVFRNESPVAIASDAGGVGWVPEGTGYTSTVPPTGPVALASNADFRWGPGEWIQADWANEIVTSGTSIGFEAYGPRRLAAIAAFLWALVLGGVALVPKYRESRS